MIEVWIKPKGIQGLWTLYDMPETLDQAKALVLARSQRDRKHDYEIRQPDAADPENSKEDGELSAL